MTSLKTGVICSAVVVLIVAGVVSPAAAVQSSGEDLVIRDPLTQKQIDDEYERLSKNQGKSKAIALPLANNGIPLAETINVGQLMSSEVEMRIRSGGVELMSASFREKLSPIIERCEQVGEDPVCANFLNEVGRNAVDIMAVTGKIDRVQVIGEHQPAKANKPGSCIFTGEVKANVTVYNVSSWTHVKDLSLTGTFQKETQISDPNVPNASKVVAPSASPCPTNGLEAEMIHNAIKNAGTANESELKNLFEPIGMVFGAYRGEQDKLYFQTTLPVNGLEETLVKIYSKGETTHPVTKKTQRTTVHIGAGKIIRPISGGNEAWVEVTQMEPGQEVKKGDMVQVAHKAKVIENIADINQTAKTTKETAEAVNEGFGTFKKILSIFGK